MRLYIQGIACHLDSGECRFGSLSFCSQYNPTRLVSYCKSCLNGGTFREGGCAPVHVLIPYNMLGSVFLKTDTENEGTQNLWQLPVFIFTGVESINFHFMLWIACNMGFSESFVGRWARALGLFTKGACKESKQEKRIWSLRERTTCVPENGEAGYSSPSTAKASFSLAYQILRKVIHWLRACLVSLCYMSCKYVGWRVYLKVPITVKKEPGKERLWGPRIFCWGIRKYIKGV